MEGGRGTWVILLRIRILNKATQATHLANHHYYLGHLKMDAGIPADSHPVPEQRVL